MDIQTETKTTTKKAKKLKQTNKQTKNPQHSMLRWNIHEITYYKCFVVVVKMEPKIIIKL